MINGAKLEVGDAGIITYLRTHLALDVKPRRSSIFKDDAPRPSPQRPLADSPDSLLGNMGYGAKDYTWGKEWEDQKELHWRDQAMLRIKGAREVDYLFTNKYHTACWLHVRHLWCTHRAVSCNVRLTEGMWALASNGQCCFHDCRAGGRHRRALGSAVA